MKITSLAQEVEGSAPIVLLYSEFGYGKTVSSIIGMVRYLRNKDDDRPLLVIWNEPRKNSRVLLAVKSVIPDLKDNEIMFTRFNDFNEMVEQLSLEDSEFHQIANKCGAIINDNISYLMNNILVQELQDQRWNAQLADEKNPANKQAMLKSLIASTKMSEEGYGALASQMNRVMEQFVKISHSGKPIIFTAWLEANPKYDRSLSAAPYFAGKMFVKSISAFAELIGKVEQRIVDGKIVYPPGVRFECSDPDNIDFMARWAGDPNAKKKLILNLDKIIG